MLLVGLAIAALGAVIAVFAPRFGRFPQAAGGAAHGPAHLGRFRDKEMQQAAA